MQITETATEGLSRSFQVTVGAEDIGRRVEARLTEVAKSIRLPGFRPGKVPVSVVRQRYAKALLGEVLEEVVNHSSQDLLKERKLRPALDPKIEIASFGEGQDLVYDMKLEILPEIEAPDISTIALERLRAEIPDEELDEALQNVAERHRKSEPVTDGSPAALGDIVVIDFTGSIDGEPFAGGGGKDQSLELGTGRFIPGFEDQLVGAHAGDHVSIQVTFPEDYAAEHLKGKAAVFETDVKEIRRKLPAVIDDSLADEVGLENLEALRSAIRDQMTGQYDRVARLKLKRDLLDLLAARYDFAVPQGMVEIEFNQIWRQFEDERKRAQEAGTYEPEEGKTEDDIKAEYRAIAERRVRLGLLLAEIGNHANIQVTQDEVNRAVAAQARQFPGQERQVVEFYQKNPGAVQSLRAPIYEEKVVDHIVEHANVTERLLPPKELVAAAQMDDEDEATAA